jgi:CRISPR/Cas system CSM-associated protein Csm2 small subunit
MTTKVTKNDENYDKMWKIRQVFNMLNVAYSKFYNPSEHLAVDKLASYK